MQAQQYTGVTVLCFCLNFQLFFTELWRNAQPGVLKEIALLWCQSDCLLSYFDSLLSRNMIVCFVQITPQTYDSLCLKCGPRSEGKSSLGLSDFSISHSINGFWLEVSKVLPISQICFTHFV